MYVFSWRTVSSLTRVLFWYLFPLLQRNSGNKHQNNPLVSAHSSTYNILYILCLACVGKVARYRTTNSNNSYPKRQRLINTLDAYPASIRRVTTAKVKYNPVLNGSTWLKWANSAISKSYLMTIRSQMQRMELFSYPCNLFLRYRFEHVSTIWAKVILL